MSKVWKMKNLIATKVVLDTRYEKKKSDTFPVKRLAAMALRGYAAFNKSYVAPPGTFTKFDLRHGSKPWSLAAIV